MYNLAKYPSTKPALPETTIEMLGQTSNLGKSRISPTYKLINNLKSRYLVGIAGVGLAIRALNHVIAQGTVLFSIYRSVVNSLDSVGWESMTSGDGTYAVLQELGSSDCHWHKKLTNRG